MPKAHLPCLLAVLQLGAAAAAQQAPTTPRLGYLYPAGARQGAKVTVTAGGQALLGASAAVVSGGGLSVRVLGYDRPLSVAEALRIRQRLEEARRRLQGATAGEVPERAPLRVLRDFAREAGVTEEDLRRLMEFQQMRSNPKLQTNPAIAEKVTLEIAVEPNARPGTREIRLMGALGLTNPLRFHVGTLQEHQELEPNDRVPDTALIGKLPAAINGQILPGDVDRFQFQARKGARVVLAIAARELVPYMADAVPGWFQCTLRLMDVKGNELAFVDDFRSSPDPVCCFQPPADGEYVVEIRDSIYRGREDFVYRLTIGEVPWVTGVFPLGCPSAGRSVLTLTGWNLPAATLTVEGAGLGIGVHHLVPVQGPIPSNGLPFAVDSLPEAVEREPNDAPKAAQAMTLPVVLNGRIGHAGDTDIFALRGRAGQEIAVEVTARRLGSPLDSVVTVLDEAGRVLAENDDSEDRACGLIAHQADSRLLVRLPRAGIYYVAVRDAQNQGGPEFAYRLRVSSPRPDFDLRVTPASISARAGTHVPITVHAIRRDGFTGEIALALRDAPEGFALSGARVPPGQDRIRLTLQVPSSRAPTPVALKMVGSARIGGTVVTREATPADEWMQAFAFHHLVPAEEWLAAISGRPLLASPIRPLSSDGLQIPAGGVAVLRLSAPAWLLSETLRLVPQEGSEGIRVESVERDGGALKVVVRAEASATPGLAGNLILDAFRDGAPQAGQAGRGPAARRLPLGTVPAVPFQVVPSPNR